MYVDNNFVIAGIKITGHFGQATNDIVASNVLDDYSYMILSFGDQIIFRCLSGLRIDSNDPLGGLYYNNKRIPYETCNGFIEPKIAKPEKNPGVLNLRGCGNNDISTEGVYTCRLMTSNMTYQNMSVGVYLNGRSKLRTLR